MVLAQSRLMAIFTPVTVRPMGTFGQKGTRLNLNLACVHPARFAEPSRDEEHAVEAMIGLLVSTTSETLLRLCSVPYTLAFTSAPNTASTHVNDNPHAFDGHGCSDTC